MSSTVSLSIIGCLFTNWVTLDIRKGVKLNLSFFNELIFILGHKVFITSENNKARICGLELIKALSNPKKKPDGLECDLDGFVKGCINMLTATKVQPSLAGKIVRFYLQKFMET